MVLQSAGEDAGASFDVAHFGSVCHWLAFPIAASYWEKQGQWNEAFFNARVQYDFPSSSE